MSPFKHAPLSGPRNIRLLLMINPNDRYIVDGAEAPDTPIICVLLEVSLDDHKEYTALSYAWDAEIPTRDVFCCPVSINNSRPEGGFFLKITPNCEKALLKMRKHRDCRYMWVDSICIDQNSTEERNHQVALMGDIYANATKVNVWLGESDEHSDSIMAWLKEVTSIGFGEGYQAVHDKLNEYSPTGCDSFRAFWSRSWFHRMWVVQEVALADSGPAKIEVYCGDSKLDWGRFLLFSILIHPTHACYEANRALSIFLLIDTIFKNRLPMPFAAKLLTAVRHRLCGDPKDKIFSLYSIFKKKGFQIREPDYTRTLEDIFCEVAAAAIEFDNSLDLILSAISEKSQTSLPSWVPDWTSPPLWVGIRIIHDVDVDRAQKVRRTNSVYQFSEDRKILKVRGRLSKVSEVFSKVQQDRHTPISVLLDFQRPSNFEHAIPVEYLAGITFHNWCSRIRSAESNSLEQQLKECLFRDAQKSEPLPITEEEWRVWNDFLGRVHDLEKEQIMDDSFWHEELAWEYSDIRVNYTVSLKYNDILRNSTGKRLFMTENRQLGIGFGNFLPDDFVAQIAGLSECIIIRKVQNGYRLVTKCFLSGTLEAELVLNDESKLVNIDLS